jgi:hypothetical protein
MTNQLEKEFQSLHDAFSKEIELKLKKAYKLVEEATAISERFGIPFEYVVINKTRSRYIPQSFKDRFINLDKKIVSELTNVNYLNGEGWYHSEICF